MLDTCTPHALVDSEYAARRASCEEAAQLLGVPALRDVNDLDAALGRLPDATMRRRVRHVVTENDRVQQAADLLRAGRIADLAPLLDASHTSMRDDFEITVPTVDLAVEAARAGRRARGPDDRRRLRRLHHRAGAGGRVGPGRRGTSPSGSTERVSTRRSTSWAGRPPVPSRLR